MLQKEIDALKIFNKREQGDILECQNEDLFLDVINTKKGIYKDKSTD